MRRLMAAGFVIAGLLPFALTTGRAQGRASSELAIERVDGHDAVAREALVKFRARPRQPDIANLAADVDALSVRPAGRSGAFRVRSRTHGAAALVARLARRPDVLYAEPNFIVHAAATPSDPLFSELWGLERIQARGAWDRTTGSTTRVVAVIDSGVDYNHPDLAPNIWIAPTAFTVTIGGVPVQCAAGTHGFNAITRSCDPMDDNGHGTHVAGTIGAAGNNQTGVAGVNWTTAIMGVKFLNAQGSGSFADAIDAIHFTIEAKHAFAASAAADVRVLSNSWGGTAFSQALLDEVTATNDEQMLFVAAAGNNAYDSDITPTYPASFAVDNVISVAASTPNDSLVWFSNYGAASVHLAAPGDTILSTTPGDSYEFLSGTSMATPHVSGAAALVLSMCDATTATLKQALLDTADRVAALAGRTITGGRLNVNSALHACLGPPAAPASLSAAAGDGRVTLTWSAALGATRYIVRRSTTTGGPYETIASAATGTTFADTAVVNDTTYYYVVSAANGLGESAHSNDASAMPRALSNLSISSLTVPAAGGAGVPLTITVTTANQGPGWAGPTTTGFFLSTNVVRDAADARLSPDRAVGRLDAATSDVATVTLTIPAETPVGTYYLFAVADVAGVEQESVESNNQLARVVRIGPDLASSALSVPSKGGAGGTLAVTHTTKNQGGGPAPASDLAFYLSADSVLGADDTVLSAGHPLPALLPNATYTSTVSLTVPPATATGAYYVIAKIDPDGRVAETSDGNNARAAATRIGPDLRVSSLSKTPSTVAAGGSAAVTDTVLNQGGGAAAAAVATGFYLSTNYTLSADDVALGGHPVPPLADGQSHRTTTTVAIPAGTAAGTYYLLAVADPANALAETFETNNVTASMIFVTIAP